MSSQTLVRTVKENDLAIVDCLPFIELASSRRMSADYGSDSSSEFMSDLEAADWCGLKSITANPVNSVRAKRPWPVTADRCGKPLRWIG